MVVVEATTPTATVPQVRDDISITVFADSVQPTADTVQQAERYLVHVGDRYFVVNRPTRSLLVALQERPATFAELADKFTHIEGKTLSIDTLRHLLHKQLPQHLFASSPTRPQATPFRFSFQFLAPGVVRPLTTHLTWLFSRWIVVPGVVAFALIEYLTAYDALLAMAVSLSWPELLVLYVTVAASGLAHELGHLTACTRYRCSHGGIGFGLLTIFPAFYADVNNAWTLSGRRRAVVDVGGLYFQCLLVAATGVTALATGNPLAYQLTWLITLLMLFTINPVFRLDGYWLLVDLTGMHNLHRRAAAALRGLVQWPPRRPRLTKESPVVGVYVIFTILSCLALGVLMLVVAYWTAFAYPRKVSTAVGAVSKAWAEDTFTPALNAVGTLVRESFWPVLLFLFLFGLAQRLGRRLIGFGKSVVRSHSF